MASPGGEHYFRPRPRAQPRRRAVRARLGGHDVELVTAGHMFSPDRIDLGTRVLVDVAPAPPPEGTFADVGCGYGPIALDLALRSPGATVWAVDVNDEALACCAENAERLGLSNVVVTRPEGVPDRVGFDLVRSNPPVRIGKPALHSLLTAWLGRLASGGVAHLVVQRNLGADSLHRWLEAQGLTVVRLASKKGYRVLEVTPAAGATASHRQEA